MLLAGKELSAEGSRAESYFQQASAVYSQRTPNSTGRLNTQRAPGKVQVHPLVINHDGSGRPARGAASQRQRPRDWEGGKPDVGHGV